MAFENGALNVMAVFNEALEQSSTAARAAYLDRICEEAPEVRARVEALLGAHARANGFLESPALATTINAAGGQGTETELAGTTIGAYRLLEKIGEGGMGVVYTAEQTGPMRRRVALKVIKQGMDTKQVIARFEAERQALAMMDHPNIAKVHEANATDSGRPYFVMELVRGIAITDYCDREQLSIPERLELFVLVCRAVQHAHQKGIIHRDLKPSNILVTVIDGIAVPKVIDFGVAKAVSGQLTERTLYTGFYEFVGTPLYMSPEQADLACMNLDTRSDIYALGVLMYELLTGTTPFDRETFQKAAFDEMRRIIREEEPPKPSTRLGTMSEARRSTISNGRNTDPRRLNQVVRGELDWIVMKALEKDRNRRYSTANGLAADVIRYLSGSVVEACPPSPWYRFRKSVRRNRVVLATATVVASALIAGTAISTWQAIEARKARRSMAAALDEARARADETQQVLDYMVKDLIGAMPSEKFPGQPTSVTEMLARVDKMISERFPGRPLLEARARLLLADLHTSLGHSEQAEPHITRALSLRTEHLGPEHPDTLAVRALQATLIDSDAWKLPGARAKVEAIAREVLEARARNLGPTHPDTIASLAFLAHVMRSPEQFAPAQRLAEQAVRLADQHLGPTHEVTLGTRAVLGEILLRRGDSNSAEPLLRFVTVASERRNGPLHADTLGAQRNLAEVLQEKGRNDEARRLLLDNIERRSRAFGFCHIRTSGPIGDLQALLRDEGDFITLRDLCERWIEQVLATPRDTNPGLRRRRAVRLAAEAVCLATLPPSIPFNFELAHRAASEAVATDGQWSGAWTFLGVVELRLGRLDQAEKAVKAAMQLELDKEEHPFNFLVLVHIHARRGQFDEAMAWFNQYSKVRKTPVWADYRQLLESQAVVYLGLGANSEMVPGQEPFE